MHVHGRRSGRARALGGDYASAAGGVLAVHAVLASLVARSRGVQTSAARTSVADAALLADRAAQRVAPGRSAVADPRCIPADRHPPPRLRAATVRGDRLGTRDPLAVGPDRLDPLTRT
jgi:hypothetical protein